MDIIQKLERRTNRRLEANLPSKLILRENNGAGSGIFEGFVRDISTNGALFESEKPDILSNFETKTGVLEIKESLSDLRDAMNIATLVAWAGFNNTKVAQQKFGLKFLEISPEDKEKIKNFITHRLDEKKEFLGVREFEKKRFYFEKTVYLSDTNLMGNAYFSHYFDWQGMAREDFIRQNVPSYRSILNSGIKFITINAQVEYKYEVYLFDKIIIDVRVENLKRTSGELVFYYFNRDTRQLVAKGRQRICFADPHGRIIPIPKDISENVKLFLDESDKE